MSTSDSTELPPLPKAVRRVFAAIEVLRRFEVSSGFKMPNIIWVYNCKTHFHVEFDISSIPLRTWVAMFAMSGRAAPAIDRLASAITEAQAAHRVIF